MRRIKYFLWLITHRKKVYALPYYAQVRTPLWKLSK